MKLIWKVIYYETTKGFCPVETFINSRGVNNRAKILSLVAQLEQDGPNLPRPYADLLEDGIHELRIKLSGRQYRSLYFFCYQEYIVLTHFFEKKTKRVPKKEITKAKTYRFDFLARYSKEILDEEFNDENI